MASIDAEACSFIATKSLRVRRPNFFPLAPGACFPAETAACSRGSRTFSPGGLSGRTPRSTFQTRAFRKTFYPDVADQDWNDWHWQARNRLRTLAQLEQVLVLSDDERAALRQAKSMLPVSITPYYMSLVSRDDRNQPLRRTVIPTTPEFYRARARPTTRWAKTATAPCRAWSTAIRTGCCCW